MLSAKIQAPGDSSHVPRSADMH